MERSQQPDREAPSKGSSALCFGWLFQPGKPSPGAWEEGSADLHPRLGFTRCWWGRVDDLGGVRSYAAVRLRRVEPTGTRVLKSNRRAGVTRPEMAALEGTSRWSLCQLPTHAPCDGYRGTTAKLPHSGAEYPPEKSSCSNKKESGSKSEQCRLPLSARAVIEMATTFSKPEILKKTFYIAMCALFSFSQV